MSRRKVDDSQSSRRSSRSSSSNSLPIDTRFGATSAALSGKGNNDYAKKQGDRLRAKLLVNNQQDPTLDTRNPLEKALNLPENQNFIFDIFEVLGRPQQGVYGAIDALQKGGDLKDAKEGWDKGIGQKLSGTSAAV